MLRFEIEKQRWGSEGSFQVKLQAEVKAGEWLCLAGPSGSGKTTILRILAGLETLDQGRIECNGQIWADSSTGLHLSPQQRRAGWLDQGYGLFPHMTLIRQWEFASPTKTNLALQSVEHSVTLKKLSEMLGLDGLLNRHPHQLSGGQQQRAALGRLLINQPRVFLLDEPLSAMDPEMRRRLRGHMRDWIRERALPGVWVTHQGQEAKAMGSTMVWMRNGEAIARGFAEDLVEYWGEL